MHVEWQLTRRVVGMASALLAGAAALSPGGAAATEVTEVRIAKQFSMGYLQFNVMARQNLLEKQAKKLGLPELKVMWATFSGPDNMNDALLSGSLDFVAGGVPGLVTIWSKTRNTSTEVKGVVGLSQYPALLNSRNPAIKTIADFTESDRIALPAVKVSIQAVLLQMAAAKAFGPENYGKLDTLTMSLSPPDVTIGLMSGSANFNSGFTVPPFQEIQLKDAKVHTVFNSNEIGMDACAVMWGTRKFHDANPTVFKALVAALTEASEFIASDHKTTAEYYLADVKAQMTQDELVALLDNPHYKISTVPVETMQFAEFMHKVGTIKAAPQSWKDMFFADIHDLPGS